MIWLILTPIMIFLISYHYITQMNVFNRQGVKQTIPWPFLGDQWKILLRQVSMLEFIKNIYNMYPNERYSGFYQFSVPTLMVRDPELIKQITVKDFDHFTDHRAFVDPDLDPLFARNLFTLKGLKWREMRATLSGSFTSSKMKNMFYLMDEAAQHFTQFFLKQNKDSIEIEMKDTYSRYTNDVVATTAFGIKVDSLSEPNNSFYSMGKHLTNLNSFARRLRFFSLTLAPKVFKALKISVFPKKCETFFSNVIYETIKTREEQGIVRHDMIHLLMEVRKGIEQKEQKAIETGFTDSSIKIGKFRQLKNLTNEDIAAQAMIFFFAGFEAISTAMCFGTYELAVNKDIQDRLRKEILETHQANNGKLTYDTLLKMKYMDMVVSEMLRKWPVAPQVDRIATQPYTIEPVNPNEKPFHLNRGDVLFLPIIGLHHDPAYFPNPMKFDPERFSDESKENIHPYTYIPFGSGPRNCIGSRFALLEMKVLFYNVLLNFQIEPTKRTSIPLKLCTKSVNPRAEGGFWLAFKRINNS